MQTLEEYINTNATFGASIITKVKELLHPKDYMLAAKTLLSLLARKSKEGKFKHDIYYYAAEIAHSSKNVEAKQLVKFYTDNKLNTYGIKV